MIDDLKKDLEGLVAQANQIHGAINYIRQKIATMEKEEATAAKPKKNGKAPDKVEAPQVPTEV